MNMTTKHGPQCIGGTRVQKAQTWVERQRVCRPDETKAISYLPCSKRVRKEAPKSNSQRQPSSSDRARQMSIIAGVAAVMSRLAALAWYVALLCGVRRQSHATTEWKQLICCEGFAAAARALGVWIQKYEFSPAQRAWASYTCGSQCSGCKLHEAQL